MLEKIGLEAIMDTKQFAQGMAQYNNGLASMESQTSGVAGKINGALKGIGMAAAGLATAAIGAFIGFGTAAYKAGETLDEAYDTIRISTGAVGDDAKQLESDFRKVFTSVPTTAKAAADVISELNKRMGATGETAQDTAKGILELTRITGGDAKKTTEDLAKITASWGISNEKASETLDKMFVASQKSGVGVGEVLQRVQQMGPQLRGMGFSLEESVGMLAKLEKAGLESQNVLVGLRLATGNLTTASMKSGDTTTSMKDRLAGLISSIKGATTETDALSIANKMFGTRSGPVMVEAIKAGALSVEDMIAAMGNASGAIQKTGRDTMDVAERFTIFKNQITTAIGPIGLALMDLGSTVLDSLGPAFEWFSGFVDSTIIPTMERVSEAIKGVIEGKNIGAAIGFLFGGDVQAQAQPLLDTFEVLAISVGEVVKAIQSGAGIDVILGNIGQGLGAVADRIIAFVTGGEQADVMVDTLGQGFNTFGGIIATLKDTTTTAFGDIGKIIASVISQVGPTLLRVIPIGQQLLSLFSKMAADIGTFFLQKIGPTVIQLAGIFNTYFPRISSAVEKALGTVRSIWEAVWPRLQNIVSVAMEQIGPVVEKVAGILADLAEKGAATFERLRPHIEALAKKIEENLVPVIKDMGKWLGETFDKIQKWIDENWPTIESVLTKLIIFITDKVVPLIKGLWENTLKPLFTGVVDGVLTMASGILKILDGDLKGGVDKIWEGIKKLFEGAINGLLGLIETVFGKGVREKIIAIAEYIGVEFMKPFNAMGQWIDQKVQEWNLLVKFATYFSEVGRDAINGLLDGLKSAWNGVKRWFDVALSQIPDWMKSLLGITGTTPTDTGGGGGDVMSYPFMAAFAAMPDLMEELGHDSILGILLGMTDAERDIVARATEIATAVVEAFRAVLELGALEWEPLDLSRLTAMADQYALTFSKIVEVMRGAYNGIYTLANGEVLNPGGGGVYEAGTAFGIAGGVRDIIAAMSETMTLLKDLADFDFPANLAGKITQMADSYALAITELVRAMGTLTATEVAAAAAIAPNVTKVVEIIKPAIDALAALGDFTPVQNLQRVIQRLGSQIRAMVLGLRDMARTLEGQGVEAAAEIADDVNTLIGMIVPALTALVALPDFAPIQNLQRVMWRLSGQIKTMVLALRDMAHTLEGQGVEAAAEMAGAITSLLGLVQPGLEALEALFSYVKGRNITAQALDFSANLTELVKALSLAFVGVQNETWAQALEAAATWYSYVGQIVAVVSGGLDALAALLGYKRNTNIALNAADFAMDLGEVARRLLAAFSDEAMRLTILGVNWGDVYSSAAGWYGLVKQIVEVVKPGLEALEGLMDYEQAQGLAIQAISFAFDVAEIARRLAAAFSDEAMRLAGLGITWATIYGNAATWYGYVQQMVGVVKPALDAIKDIASYEQAQNLVFAVVRFENDLIEVAWGLASAFGDEAGRIAGLGVDWKALYEAAGQWYGYVGQIVGVVKPALDALTSLANYEQVMNLPFAMVRFENDLVEVAWGLASAFGDESRRLAALGIEWATLYKDAAGWYGYVQQMVGIIKPGLDAIKALAKYESALDLVLSVARFANDLIEVARGLSTAFGAETTRLASMRIDWDALYRGAAVWAGYVQQILGLVKPGLDAIKELTDYTRVQNIAIRARDFGADLVLVASALVEAFNQFSLEAEEEGGVFDSAVIFAQGTQAILNVVKTGLEAIKELTGYVRVEGIAANAAAFGADLVAVATEMVLAFQAFSISAGEGESQTGVLAAAADFYQDVQKIVGVVKPGLDAIESLTGYMAFTGIGERAALFAEDLRQLTEQMVLAFQAFSVSGLPGQAADSVVAAAAAFYKDVQTIVATVKPAIDALYSVGTYVTSTGLVAKMEQFKTDLMALLTRMVAVYTAFKTTLVPETATFFTTVNTIATSVKTALDALKALGTYTAQANLATAMNIFVTDLTSFLNMALGVYNLYRLSALPATQAFFATVQAILASIKASIDYLKAIAGSSGAGAGGGGVSPAMDIFASDLNEFYIGLNGIFSTWTERHSPLATEQAAAFALATQTVLGSVVQAINYLTTLANYRGQGAGLMVGLQAFLADMATFYGALQNQQQQMGGAGGVGNANLFKTAASTAQTSVVAGINSIAGIAGTTGGATSALGQFVTNLGTQLTAANTTVMGRMGDILTSFRGQNTNIALAGVAAVQGFASGITSTIPTALSAVEALAQQTVAKLRATLQTGSPSRVAENIGMSIPLGLAGGILAGAPSAINAAALLAEEVTGALTINTPALALSGLSGGIMPMTAAGMQAQAMMAAQTTNVNVNMGGVNINNGMDLAVFDAHVRQVVTRSIYR